jgi:hypothetical protein
MRRRELNPPIELMRLNASPDAHRIAETNAKFTWSAGRTYSSPLLIAHGSQLRATFGRR